MSKRRQKGHGVPVAEGRLSRKPLATGRPAPERRHVRLYPGFIDEDQPGRINSMLVFQPSRPLSGNIWPVLFAGDQRLFL